MIVLDASALVKLVIEEKNSEAARKAYKKELAMHERVLVPYLALPEALNSLWKYHTLRKELSDEKFESAMNDLLSIFNKLEKVPENSIAKLASEIAHVHKLAVYDSIYVAISRANNTPLLTFDEPVIEKTKELGIKLAV